ncbi:MAG: hypothetical protein JWM34_312 [Ilumatobacteraceae bacterium]|nr:hypothetical protein [Ilumatobacteraceae bacterium]
MSTPPPPPPGYNPPPPGNSGFPQAPPPPPAYAPQQGYGAPPPGYTAYQQAPTRAFAGFWARVGAFIIDMLVGLLFSLPGIIARFVVPTHYTDCTVNGEDGICKTPTGGGLAIILVLSLVGGIAFIVFYCKKMGKGQTWGQQALSISVVDKDTGAPIGTGRAVGRYFALILSYLPCFLGFIWMLWDKNKQTFHDKLVSSVVVKS